MSPEADRENVHGVVDEELVENVEVLIEDGQKGMVLNIVAELHPADIAQLIQHLPAESSEKLFDWLPNEQSSAVLPELESAQRSDFLEDVPAVRLVEMLDRMDTDDAADVLADVDEGIAEEVIPRLEDAAEVGALMGYADDTAGGLMETDFVAVPGTATVADATEEVRRMAEDVDDPYVVYVLDSEERLVGLVPLKRLILARATTPLLEIADTDFVKVEPELDQEEVAHIMDRYDLIALPVVAKDGRLLGRITIDDVVDVIREEAEEDLQRVSGISGDEEFSASVFSISRGRLLWLLLGLCGAYVSGLVIVGFEAALQVAPVLAVFIPVVMAMAGNAGIQSSAIAVQGLASGTLWGSNVLRRLGKELAVALINGAVLAIVLGLIVMLSGFGDDTQRLATTAGIALMIVIVLATIIGAAVPLVLSRMKIDPALAMGPFIMVSNDILGLLVFFVVATVLYL
ncbi:MAG: magnesium transporter [Rubricoccaceae bacterium]|nr:magnesium transporter [Rubricoccaceae bacterium]